MLTVVDDTWLRNFNEENSNSPWANVCFLFDAPSICQFTEILWCLEYVNLQKFNGAPSMLIYRDFMVPRYVNLQRFYGAPSMSIYIDFMVPRVCQFTEILWCSEYVNLQRFYGALSM